MRSRFLFAAVMLCHCALSAQVGRADDIYVQLFPLTGEIQLRNKSAALIQFDYFSILSASGTLNNSPLVWKSISDTYDLSGNGFIDPVANWSKISAVATELTEGVFAGPGGALPANRAISLGNIWNPLPTLDLAAEVQDTIDISHTVTLEYALAGDYFRDGVVDQLDYGVWWKNIGSASNLDADGNLNGVVDTADYTVWRHNMGNSIPSLTVVGAGSGSGAGLVLGGAVPEPTAAAMSVLALCSLLVWMRRARAAGR